MSFLYIPGMVLAAGGIKTKTASHHFPESCRKAGDPDTEAYYLHQACRCWTRVLCRPLWECNAGDHLTQALVQAREEVEKYFLGTMSELSLKE